jgi:hypothetical protein
MAHASTRVSIAALTMAAAIVPASATSATAAPIPVCSSRMVHLHHHDGGAGLGHAAVVFTVINISHAACSVSGYLRVSELASHSVTLLRAKPTRSGYLGGIAGHGPLPTVALAPGATASALLEGQDSMTNGHACPATWGVAVRLPVVSTLIRMRFVVGICGDVEIHPVVAGRAGRAG